MAVVANEDGDLMMQDPLGQENAIITSVTDANEVIEEEEEEEEMEMVELKEAIADSKPINHKQNDPKLSKEMENCFGFDEVYYYIYY